MSRPSAWSPQRCSAMDSLVRTLLLLLRRYMSNSCSFLSDWSFLSFTYMTISSGSTRSSWVISRLSSKCPSANHWFDTCSKFRHIERFSDVVVHSDIEPGQAIVQGSSVPKQWLFLFCAPFFCISQSISDHFHPANQYPAQYSRSHISQFSPVPKTDP